MIAVVRCAAGPVYVCPCSCVLRVLRVFCERMCAMSTMRACVSNQAPVRKKAHRRVGTAGTMLLGSGYQRVCGKE